MVQKLPKGSNGTVRWVNRNLSDDELSAYDGAPLDLRTKMDDTSVLIERGYRLTLGWDKRSGCPICCHFGPDEGDANVGLAISTRDPDAETAWGLALYKHFEVLGEEWGEAAPPPAVRRG